MLITLRNHALHWNAKGEKHRSNSSSQGEFQAILPAVQEIRCQRMHLEEFGFEIDKPSLIYEDNQSAIKMSENPVFHNRTKHIALMYLITRDAVESFEIELKYVTSQRQLADIFTKALSAPTLTKFRGAIMSPARTPMSALAYYLNFSLQIKSSHYNDYLTHKLPVCHFLSFF
jgi:hypothetical protein